MTANAPMMVLLWFKSKVYFYIKLWPVQMGFSLEKIVPWGRNLKEYVPMFSMSENDLEKHLLGCTDGPSSFNTEVMKRGGFIISFDPIYSFSALEIRERIEATYDLVVEQTRKNADEFCWDHVKSVEELGLISMSVMNQSLEDYQIGNDDQDFPAA